MHKALLTIGLLALTVALCSCQVFNHIDFESNQFVITGEVIPVEQGSTAEDAVDSKIPAMTVTVSHETVDEKGNVETVDLASGEYVAGKVLLSGKVEEPVLATITVTIEGDDTPLTTSTMIAPRANLKFGVYQNKDRRDIKLKGQMLRSSDPQKKFTLTANLSSFGDFDLNDIVLLIGYGSLYVDDGRVYFEGDVDKPYSTMIYVVNDNGVQTAKILLEAGVNYTVESLGHEGGIGIMPDRDSLHSQLINSWMMHPDYITAHDNYEVALAQYRAAKDTEQAAGKLAGESSSEISDRTFAESNPVAPECQHVDLSSSISTVQQTISTDDVSDYEVFADEMTSIQRKTLQEVISESNDWQVINWAFNLGAYDFNAFTEQLQALHELEARFDDDATKEKITSRISILERMILVQANDEAVVPGQLAPRFTLANLNGDEVSLVNVLQDNEIVLVDFWASWCGPCIATFPALKKMYDGYQEDGFEIITISIDSTVEDWEEGSEENELPWIDLADTNGEGEMVGWDAMTATEYGVNSIPRSFLVDSEGCILEKRLSTDDLAQVLATRWGALEEITD